MLNRIFSPTHRFRCPDEHQLAAWVDQQLIGAERERVESHLAKCDSCLQQVGFLVKQAEGVATLVPAGLLRRAEELDAPAQGSPTAWKRARAAAAIAVVAISAMLWREVPRNHAEVRSAVVATAQQPQAPEIVDNPNSEMETSVRSGSSNVSPTVLSPQPGMTVHASDFIIRWEPIDKAAAYEVRVVTADGDLVWRKRVQETSVRPPSHTLRPGMKYFVWVRALLPDGKTQRSAAVSFIGG
jgi:putative zinc finger protein